MAYFQKRFRNGSRRLGLRLKAVAAFIWLAPAAALCAPQDKPSSPFHVAKIMQLATSGTTVAVAWSPDGSRIAAASDWNGIITIWDNAGRQLQSYRVPIDNAPLGGSLAFAEDASKLIFYPPLGAEGDITLAVRDAQDGTEISPIWGYEHGSTRGPARSYQFKVSPDHTVLAVTCLNHRPNRNGSEQYNDIVVYRGPDWKFMRSYQLPTTIYDIEFFAGGRKAVLGGYDGTVSVIDDFESNKPPRVLAHLPSISENAVAGSPDGRFIFVGAGDGVVTALVLGASDGAPVGKLSLGGPDYVRQAQWDPKGRYVAFLDLRGQIYLWQPSDPQRNFTKINLNSNAFSFALSPDGDQIAVTGGAGVTVYALT